MKKTWTILCAAALISLSLAGCAGNKTQGTHSQSPAPDLTPSAMPSQDIHGTAESGDLAGADGRLDGDAGDMTPDRGENSPLEEAGEGVRDTLDEAGRDVRNTLDEMGDAARDVGQSAKNAIEGR